jgi:hypothetical protein
MITESKDMSDPTLTVLKPTDKQLEIFRVLYPIFKDEVFRRREQMMRLTALASALLLGVLVTQPLITRWSDPNPLTQWLVISGVMVFSGLFAFLILQHRDRHRMAKQQVIALEQTLGLYQGGWPANGEALFPKSWQSDWTADRSALIYLILLAALTGLVICAILIQM